MYLLEGGGGIRIVEPSVPQYFIDDWATMHRGEDEDEAERISHQVAATGMKKKDESVPEGFKRTSQTYDLYFPESIKGPTICKLGQFGSSKEKTKLRVKTNFRVCASLVHTNIDKNGEEEKIYHENSYMRWKLVIDGEAKPLGLKEDEEDEDSDDEAQFNKRMSQMNVD